MSNSIIGVMGPGNATKAELNSAYEIGRLVAGEGWVLLTGGRNAGVMDSASRGAKENGGTTVGILPDTNTGGVSDYIDIPLVTGMGSARNNINILSSDVVIACGCGAGTTSELMLALKAFKPVIVLHRSTGLHSFLEELTSRYPRYRKIIHYCSSPSKALVKLRELLDPKTGNFN